MQLDPKTLAWRDVYKLMIGAVVPRPIAFVSTLSRDGIPNLAAFSFFNAVCPDPFIISFAPMRRGSDGQKKDTLRNIEETEEFVVNVVTEDIVEKMNLTAPEFPPEVDEFQIAGFTPVQSTRVTPPRVGESPISMECKLKQIISFGDHVGSGSLVIGEVVYLHVRDDLYENGRILLDRYRPVARLAGDEYARVTDRFVLKRPKS
jgi:flavin reductase (DIM6/NTAB) family NADH-FMN oxidoreductase RutF